MHTIRLRINDKVYDRFIWLLSKFNRDELEIIPESSDFIENQRYLLAELDDITQGNANFVSEQEANERLERKIRQNEDSV
jgi:hypothetical protein